MCPSTPSLRGVPGLEPRIALSQAARWGSSATPDQREANEGRLSDGTAMGLDERALVVFLQLTCTEKGERQRLEVLRDRAVVATEMSFTITDPRRADDPLIWVNPAFTRSPATPRPKSWATTAGSCRAAPTTAQRSTCPRRRAAARRPLRR
jgi:hypothetical protein